MSMIASVLVWTLKFANSLART